MALSKLRMALPGSTEKKERFSALRAALAPTPPEEVLENFRAQERGERTFETPAAQPKRASLRDYDPKARPAGFPETTATGAIGERGKAPAIAPPIPQATPAQRQLGLDALQSAATAYPSVVKRAVLPSTSPLAPIEQAATRRVGPQSVFDGSPESLQVPLSQSLRADQQATLNRMPSPSRNLVAGFGDVAQGLGSVANLIGADGVSKSLKSAGASLQNVGKGVEGPDFEGLKSIKDPEYLLSKGVRSLAFPLAAAPLAIGGFYGGAAAAGAAGIGAVGTALAAAATGALASRPFESAIEAGGVYEEALARGMSEAEARTAARKTFWRNNALVVMDAGELLLALAPLPAPLKKILGAVDLKTLSGVKRAAVGVGRVAATGLMEAIEEVDQDAISRESLGDKFVFDKQAQEAALLGGLMGGGMGAAGSAFNLGGRDATRPIPGVTTNTPFTLPPAQAPATTPASASVEAPQATQSQVSPVVPPTAQTATSRAKLQEPQVNSKWSDQSGYDHKLLAKLPDGKWSVRLSSSDSDYKSTITMTDADVRKELGLPPLDGDAKLDRVQPTDPNAPGAPLKNGFFRGPVEGSRYRIDPNNTAAGGSIYFDRRANAKDDGTVSSGHLTKNGGFTELNFLDGDSIAELWIPSTETARQQAVEILQELGKVGADNTRHIELLEQLDEVVYGDQGLQSPAAARASAPPTPSNDAVHAEYIKRGGGFEDGDIGIADRALWMKVRKDLTQQAQTTPAKLDRVQTLRDANPGMDERAIADLAKTTANLSDAEFTAFATRVGKPDAPAQQTAPSPDASATVRTASLYRNAAAKLKEAPALIKSLNAWTKQNGGELQGFGVERALFEDGVWRPVIATTQAGAKPDPAWTALKGKAGASFYTVADTAPMATASPAEAIVKPVETPATTPPQTGEMAVKGWYINEQDRPVWISRADAVDGYRGPYSQKEVSSLTGTAADYLRKGKDGNPVYTPDYPAPAQTATDALIPARSETSTDATTGVESTEAESAKTVANLSNDALLERIRTLNTEEALDDLLDARKEGIRRGIVTKIETDLSEAEQERLEKVWREVGRAWGRYGEMENESKRRDYTPKGQAAKRSLLPELEADAVTAEQALWNLEVETGLQHFGKYRFIDSKTGEPKVTAKPTKPTPTKTTESTVEGEKEPGETISDRMGGRRTATVGTVTDGDRKLRISLRPDNSDTGTYSVVVSSDEGSESFRMKYKGGEPLAEVMKHFEDYLNEPKPGRFKVEVDQPTPPTVAKPAKPKREPDPVQTRIKELEARRSLTQPQEKELERLKAVPKDWATRWQPGDGVSFRAGGSLSRGWAIESIDGNQATLLTVRDVGQTTDGSDDAGVGRSRMTMNLWELQRDKASDSTRLRKATEPTTPPEGYTRYTKGTGRTFTIADADAIIADLAKQGKKAIAIAPANNPKVRQVWVEPAKTEIITPANDTPVGRNDAGEQLYERTDGSRYRMRLDRKDRPNGYPDFGGDLAPVEDTAEPTKVEPDSTPGAAKDSNIGRTWSSPYGTQRVVSVEKGKPEFGMEDLYDVVTEGTGEVRRYPAKRLEETIRQQEHELTPEYAEELRDKAETEELRRASYERQATKEAAKKATIKEYLGTLNLTAMQRGKLEATLSAVVSRRSASSGKVYQGTRLAVVQEMVKDGYAPTTEEMPVIKEPARAQWNRMDNRQQEDFEKRRKAAGFKTEYALKQGDESYFVVTKAEFDLATQLTTKVDTRQEPEKGKEATTTPTQVTIADATPKAITDLPAPTTRNFWDAKVVEEIEMRAAKIAEKRGTQPGDDAVLQEAMQELANIDSKYRTWFRKWYPKKVDQYRDEYREANTTISEGTPISEMKVRRDASPVVAEDGTVSSFYKGGDVKWGKADGGGYWVSNGVIVEWSPNKPKAAENVREMDNMQKIIWDAETKFGAEGVDVTDAPNIVTKSPNLTAVLFEVGDQDVTFNKQYIDRIARRGYRLVAANSRIASLLYDGDKVVGAVLPLRTIDGDYRQIQDMRKSMKEAKTSFATPPTTESSAKSKDHIAFVTTENGTYELFRKGGGIYRAPLSDVVMPDGNRTGRWEGDDRADTWANLEREYGVTVSKKDSTDTQTSAQKDSFAYTEGYRDASVYKRSTDDFKLMDDPDYRAGWDAGQKSLQKTNDSLLLLIRSLDEFYNGKSLDALTAEIVDHATNGGNLSDHIHLVRGEKPVVELADRLGHALVEVYLEDKRGIPLEEILKDRGVKGRYVMEVPWQFEGKGEGPIQMDHGWFESNLLGRMISMKPMVYIPSKQSQERSTATEAPAGWKREKDGTAITMTKADAEALVAKLQAAGKTAVMVPNAANPRVWQVYSEPVKAAEAKESWQRPKFVVFSQGNRSDGSEARILGVANDKAGALAISKKASDEYILAPFIIDTTTGDAWVSGKKLTSRNDFVSKLRWAIANNAYMRGSEIIGIDNPEVTPDWQKTIADLKREAAKRDEAFTELNKSEHRAAIEMALALGKPVPAEVLKDYPDLAPKTSIKESLRSKVESVEGKGIIDPRMGIVAPGTVGQSKRTPMPSVDTPAENPDIEARWQLAGEKVKPESLKVRMKRNWDTFWARATRDLEFLPRGARHAELSNMLRQLKKGEGIASDEAAILLQGITVEMNADEARLFRRAVAYRNMLENVETAGENLAPDTEMQFGFTPVELRKEWARVKEAMDRSPSVSRAFEDRQMVWKEINDNYAKEYQKLHGKLPPFDRKFYFRQEVIARMTQESMQAQGASGGEVNAKKNRSWLKRRGDTFMDFSNRYLEVEHKVLTEMIYDTQKNGILNFVNESENVHAVLKRQAKAANNKAIMPHFQEMADAANRAPDRSPNSKDKTAMDMYRGVLHKKQAMAIAKLQKLAASGGLPGDGTGRYDDLIEAMAEVYEENRAIKADNPEWTSEDLATLDDKMMRKLMNYMTFLMNEGESSAASGAAALFYTGVREKETYLKETLGKEYQPWQTVGGVIPKSLIPEGYGTYQPDPGEFFYQTWSIADKYVQEAMDKAMETVGVSVDKLRRVKASGGQKEAWVLPNEIIQTLKTLNKRAEKSGISLYQAKGMRLWKKHQLLFPTRAFKYNLRNLSGDVDATIAGNWRAFRKVPQAVSDLWSLMFRGSAPSDKLARWIHRGGALDILQVQDNVFEMEGLKRFQNLIEKKGLLERMKGGEITAPLKEVARLYKTFFVEGTAFREYLLRYANFLEISDQLDRGAGKPISYGASLRSEIDAIENFDDKAYKMANDLLGAYDEVSVLGQEVSESWIPFFRFTAVNHTRYTRIIRNAIEDGEGTSTKGRIIAAKLAGLTIKSPIIAYNIGRTFVLVSLLTSVVAGFNNLFFPEEEDELPDGVGGRAHVILGIPGVPGSAKDKDGKIRAFTRIGSLTEWLEWFGVLDFPEHAKRYLNGTMTAKELVIAMAMSPVNKVYQSLGPYKAIFEGVSGKTTYPDMTKPRSIRDRYEFIADSLAVGDIYRHLAGKPTRGLGAAAENLLYYKYDPQEVAYNEVIGLKYKWLAKNYGGGGGIEPTGKMNALYYLKQAIRYGDKEAMDKYMTEYDGWQGTKEGIKTSVDAMHPLKGNLTKKQEKEFKASLTPKELETLEKAERFWKDVLKSEDYKDLPAYKDMPKGKK